MSIVGPTRIVKIFYPRLVALLLLLGAAITSATLVPNCEAREVCKGGLCSVEEFGASGSLVAVLGTIDARSNALRLQSAGDFKNGQGIMLFHAGPAALYQQPTVPTLTLVGTPGSTEYCYKIAIADYWGGISSSSRKVCLFDGPRVSTPDTYARIEVGKLTCSYCAAVIYRQVGGVGTFNRIGIILEGGSRIDDSNLPVRIDNGLPNIAPQQTLSQNLIVQITRGGGTRRLYVSPAATSAGENIIVWHDDSHAVQAAVDAVVQRGGGWVEFGRGSFNLNQVSYWTGSTWNYINPNTPPLSNRMLGVIHLGNQSSLRGIGSDSTILRSILFASVYQGMLASANPTRRTIPSGICNSGAERELQRYGIDDASEGDLSIRLSKREDTTKFRSGDLVRYGGGVNGVTVSCTQSNPTAENNQILSVDSNMGILHLRYPLSKAVPFGKPGTAPFVEIINMVAHHDITLTDMTIDALGGAQTIALGDVVYGRVSRVKMPSVTWSGTINFNESQDIVLDQIDLVSASSDEFDQVRNFTVSNSHISLRGGMYQWAFTEGASGIKLLNDKIESDDSLCGLNGGRCDFGGPVILLFVAGAAGIQLINNHLAANWVKGGTGIRIWPLVEGVPASVKFQIERNVIQLNSHAGIQGLQLESPLVGGSILQNDVEIQGGSTSWALYPMGGVYRGNFFETEAPISSFGIIRLPTAEISGRTSSIENNTIVSHNFNLCVGPKGVASALKVLKSNRLVGCSDAHGDNR